jgi:hypothetical protein
MFASDKEEGRVKREDGEKDFEETIVSAVNGLRVGKRGEREKCEE